MLAPTYGEKNVGEKQPVKTPIKTPEAASKKNLEKKVIKNSKKIDKKSEKAPDKGEAVTQQSKSDPAVHPSTEAQLTKPQKLPLPRFVCLKANSANLHVGPGDQYPIEWRYVKQFLPVEVIAEFDHWRQIRDIHGTVGWVHKTLLSSKRFAIIQNKVANLYADPHLESRIIATVEPGVIGKVIECDSSLCKVDIQGIRGWVKRDFLFGIYPDEVRF